MDLNVFILSSWGDKHEKYIFDDRSACAFTCRAVFVTPQERRRKTGTAKDDDRRTTTTNFQPRYYMKKTIKQWCSQYQINWLGQGNLGQIRYDWKLVRGKGKVAIFSSTIKGSMPEFHTVNDRKILLFPNINRSKNNGMISEAAFLNLIEWVDKCLDGNLCEYTSQNQHVHSIAGSVANEL